MENYNNNCKNPAITLYAIEPIKKIQSYCQQHRNLENYIEKRYILYL